MVVDDSINNWVVVNAPADAKESFVTQHDSWLQVLAQSMVEFQRYEADKFNRRVTPVFFTSPMKKDADPTIVVDIAKTWPHLIALYARVARTSAVMYPNGPYYPLDLYSLSSCEAYLNGSCIRTLL